MKNILIVITNFRHGGTNKSLENLLSLINTEMYQIDVYAMEHFGPYKEMLQNCTIIPEYKWLSALIANYKDTKGIARLRSFVIKILRILCSKLKCNFTDKLYEKTANSLLRDKNYDAVIAYSEGAPTAFLAYVNHQNKIAWIHCDYSSYMTINNQPNENKLYESYKSIVCVSEYTKKEFCRIMPLYNDVTFSLHNVLNVQDIYEKAKVISSDDRFNKDKFTILSIGTFYPIKRLSIVPDIANELVKRGKNFSWYVIGSIGDYSEFNSFKLKIKNYKLSDYVQYLGEKQNPYYYLKHSDLFVSLSVTEACPYVINESKVLHIPIVCTDFPSAPEFVEDNEIGFITTIDDVENKIDILINDTNLYQKIKCNAEKNSYNNDKIMNKFYEIISKQYDKSNY